MTGNGLFGELAAWSGLAASPPASITRPTVLEAAHAPVSGDLERVKIGPILDVCDRVLGELGKRDHQFGWLVPSGIDGDRPAVDAYYPGRNLVVLGHDRSGPDHVLCAELAAHKLGLFTIDLGGFRANPGQAFSRLIGELRKVAPAAPVAPAPVARPPVTRPPVAPAPPAGEATPAADLANGGHPQEALTAPAPPPAAAAPAARTARTARAPAPAPVVPMPAIFAPPPPPPPPASAPPAAVAPRPSAFQPLVSAVQRFTAAPAPYVLPREPADPPDAPTLPAAGPAFPPAAPALPWPAAPPFAAAPPPPSPAPRPLATAPPAAAPRSNGRPVGLVLQQFMPPPAPEAEPAPPAAFEPAAPGSFVATPFPFARSAPVPLAPILESLVAETEREARRRRIGQRQAEAAARAARFVDARAARQGTRLVRPTLGPAASSRPGALFSLAPRVPTVPAFATAAEPVRDLDGRHIARSTARAEAIERALAHGRGLPDPRPSPPKLTPQAEADELVLGFTVACLMAIELYVGVALFMFSGGPVALGFGLVLDAAARALGTIAATRAGEEWGPGWRWICGLGGSPAVAWFAFQRHGNRGPSDLAPLAGPIAVIAVIVILIGLAGISAGV
jgi:hypothetical protein